MPKSVVVESVQVGADGSLVVRANKLVTLGAKVHSKELHLHRVYPECDIAESLNALNACMEGNDWPALSAEDAAFVQKVGATRPAGEKA